jgi:hypothetical protein
MARVPASGGKAAPLSTPDYAKGEVSHRWVHFLPEGRRFVYYSQSLGTGKGTAFLASLDRPQDRVTLFDNQTQAVYSPPRGKYPGYLLWLRESTLTAQPFDPASGKLSGEAVPLPGAEHVASIGGVNLSEFSVSLQGTLAFGSGDDRYQISWFDRQGKPLGNVGQPQPYVSLQIAPDGRRVAAAIADRNGRVDF